MLTATLAPPAPALNGSFVLPGDPSWDDARSAFNLLLDQHPAAVAFPADADDVAAAVAYARDARPAGRAAGDRPQRRARSAASSARCCSTSAGSRTSRSTPGAQARARRRRRELGARRAARSPPTASPRCTAPRPTSASPATRSAAASAGSPASTACSQQRDRVRARHGRRRARPRRRRARADLFWALRGGGGNFGVVTALEFDLYAVARSTRARSSSRSSARREVLHAWSELLPALPDEVTSCASDAALPADPGRPRVRCAASSFAVVEARLPRQRGGRPRRCWRRCATSARRWTPSRWCRRSGSRELAMDPRDPLPSTSRTSSSTSCSPEAIDDLSPLPAPSRAHHAAVASHGRRAGP